MISTLGPKHYLGISTFDLTITKYIYTYNTYYILHITLYITYYILYIYIFDEVLNNKHRDYKMK